MRKYVHVDWSRWVIGVDVDRWAGDSPYHTDLHTDILIFLGPVAIQLMF